MYIYTDLDGLDAASGVGRRQGRPPVRRHGYLGEADAVLAVGAAGRGEGTARQATLAARVVLGARGPAGHARQAGVQQDADALVAAEEQLATARGLAARVEEDPEDRRVAGYARAHLRGEGEIKFEGDSFCRETMRFR